jgi:hypothetical protein
MKKSLFVTGLSYLVVVGWGCLPMLSNGVSMAFAQRPQGGIASTASAIDFLPMAIASNPIAIGTVAQTSTPPKQKKQPIRTQQTKRLKIEIDITSPNDLLVKEGQTVTANQLIAERRADRSNLSTQLQEIKLSLERLKLAPKVSQVPPISVKAVDRLPPKISYVEEQAQITAATAKVRDLERKYILAQAAAKTTLPETEKLRGSKIAVKQVEEKIVKHQQKIDALKTLEDMDEAVKEHEQVKLRELNRQRIETQNKLEQDIATEGIAEATRLSHLADVKFEITDSQRDLELARARLATSLEKRRQLEFDARIKEAQQEEQVQRLELERVRMMEVDKLASHDREYQIAQLILKKGQVQKQLETIGVVKTPHQGMIRRVKLVSQHSNVLRYEVVLVYSLNPIPTPTSKLPQWKEEN